MSSVENAQIQTAMLIYEQEVRIYRQNGSNTLSIITKQAQILTLLSDLIAF